MVDNLEQRIHALVRRYHGVYFFKNPILNAETDLDTDLALEDDEAEELMNAFFEEFDVDKGNFSIKTYYPDVPFSLNPFKKSVPVPVPDFTIGMLIASAKAGKWLY
ncbi:acyl carrier protein [Rahnella sp. AA]|uniref:DUF1493 family protein n=1 Tax=Rahnella sp. AA TaxID=2057180 RepID=UPI000C34EA43|nr:DUF1493 family protein [Rahnella sp. AA]PKE27579.1 acyl carrier protein [Rahnella sp. AA]